MLLEKCCKIAQNKNKIQIFISVFLVKSTQIIMPMKTIGILPNQKSNNNQIKTDIFMKISQGS